jgi:hypothetical protein
LKKLEMSREVAIRELAVVLEVVEADTFGMGDE